MAPAYEVRSAIRHCGRRHAEGAVVEMDEALATDLVARGKLSPAKPGRTAAKDGQADPQADPRAEASGGEVSGNGAAAKAAAPRPAGKKGG